MDWEEGIRMSQKEITISGVGGQGLILSGTLIAEAAAIIDRKKATLSSEYGVETRGTFAKSDVIVSDEEIYFPNVTKPDFIICLHQIAYERYLGKVEEGTVLIYDSGEVTPKEGNKGKEVSVDITAMAKELGEPATANIITIGLIVGAAEVISTEAAKAKIAEFLGGKGQSVVDLNLRAFDMGYEKGKQLEV